MSNFYAHVCKNGHKAVSYKRVKEEQRCKTCGAEMIDACPACGELIKKWHYYGSVIMGPKEFERPSVCKACGAVYPWAED